MTTSTGAPSFGTPSFRSVVNPPIASHGRLQKFETTRAKIKGWSLKGVSIGVVLIILGCGHLLMDPGHASITYCFISQVSVTPYLQIFDDDSLVSLSNKARKTACVF